MPIALLALAIGAFGIGTTEFVIMGLLPDVARDFHVSIPVAGYLISGYALGVVVGAPLLTAASVRLPRKTMLLGLMAMFTVGNLVAAMSVNYEMLLIARVLTALPHGAFFGVGSVVAAGMVRQTQRAKAIALMFAGLTLSNVIGVPVSTLLGQAVGWRAAFAVVAGIGVLAVLGVAILVPHQPRPAGVGLGRELAVFRRPQVWLSLAIVMFGFGGVFASFSYITPMLTEVAGYSPTAVTGVLALFGAGMTVGNLLGGHLADKALLPSLFGALGALSLVLLAFVFSAHWMIPAAVSLFGVGAAGMAAVPAVQTRIMDAAAGAPTLAAAAIQSAFNIANAAGAFLGGLVIEAGLGLTAPNGVGAVLAAVGLGFALLAGFLDRRGRVAPVEPVPVDGAGVRSAGEDLVPALEPVG